MIDNRRRLRDTSICLIVIIAFDVFATATTLITQYFDGSFAPIFAEADPTVVTISKILLGVLLAFELFLIVAQVLIGVKGIKISENPTAETGYITAAKVFFILGCIAAITYVVGLFSVTSKTVFDTVLSLVSTLCDVAIYACFIKYANAVRQDALK